MGIILPVLLLLMGIIAWCDFRYRSIPVLLLFLFAILITFFSLLINACYRTLQDFLYNIIFLALQLLMLTAYFSIKARKAINIFNSVFGWGDVTMLGILTMGFTLVNYIVFLFSVYFLSLTYSLLKFLLLRDRSYMKKIPLAGFLATGYFVLLILYRLDPACSPFDDYWFFNLTKVY